VLSRALAAGAAVSVRGHDAVLDAARAELATEPEVDVDYLELRDTDLGPAPAPGARATAACLVAARVGATRLIDNAPHRVLTASRGEPP
jgi:pantoate--beta-alanine ligase